MALSNIVHRINREIAKSTNKITIDVANSVLEPEAALKHAKRIPAAMIAGSSVSGTLGDITASTLSSQAYTLLSDNFRTNLYRLHDNVPAAYGVFGADVVLGTFATAVVAASAYVAFKGAVRAAGYLRYSRRSGLVNEIDVLIADLESTRSEADAAKPSTGDAKIIPFRPRK
jgi:hypothetical protein